MAAWLDEKCPQAAASLEGLAECFTINRLDLPLSLHRLCRHSMPTRPKMTEALAAQAASYEKYAG